MLMSSLRTLVNNLFYESFDITFMGNKKKCQNINFFFFSHKKIFLTGFLISALRALISISHKLFVKVCYIINLMLIVCSVHANRERRIVPATNASIS